MNFVPRKIRLLLVLLLIGASSGCHPTQPFYLRGDGDLNHYVAAATKVEHPDVTAPPLEDVTQSQSPLTLTNPEFQEIWDLTLQECVSIAMNNAKIIRGGIASRQQNGTLFAGGGEGTIVQSPNQFATVYNPALVESHPGFTVNNLFPDGGVNQARQGVEAALSEFDAQLRIAGGNNPNAAGALLSSTNRPQNVNNQFTGFPDTLDLKAGALTAELTKRTIEGTQFSIRNGYDYDQGNQRGQFQALNSTWTTTFEVEARHPLLAGRGAQINRIPIVIARISNDVELLNLQNQLNEMLCNIEIRYWDLHNAYRTLETAKVGRDASLLTWRIVYDKYKQGAESVQPEAQSREQYFAFRAQVEIALRELYNAENELRLIMGLAATDGRLIRPIDEPTLARVEFDWNDALCEAINRRPELVSKRWQLKQREMEIILARNRLLPQLDVGALYRWIGVGDNLTSADRNGQEFPAAGSTAFEELTNGNYQEFAVFGQFAMPIGFRRELAAVKHFQLRLAREKALLEDMELDVTHGLTKAVRNLDANYQLSQTNANRWAAAAREVESLQELYKGGKASLDLVLEAQRRRAAAQNAFWTSVAEYNKSIADVHCRKASILDYNGMAFEEGPWPEKAYWDAVGLARERDASYRVNYGWSRPKVISRGELKSQGAFNESRDGAIIAGPGVEFGSTESDAEVIETPAPNAEGTPPSILNESTDELPPGPSTFDLQDYPSEQDQPGLNPGGEPPLSDPNIAPQPEARRPNSILKSADFNPLRGRMGSSGISQVQFQEPLRDTQDEAPASKPQP